MTGFNTRRGVTTVAMEAQYLCHHCDRSRWTAGGAASLGRHLARVHGVDVGPFPQFECVDSSGWIVDHDGARAMVGRRPVRPGEGLDGLVRAVELRTRVIT